MDSFPSSNLVKIFCADLNIEIEFPLNFGTFARIGSGQDMEIVLPLLGVRELEVRVDRDSAGNLIANDGQTSYLVISGMGIWIGPHYFIFTLPLCPQAETQSANHVALPLIPKAKIGSKAVEVPWYGLSKRALTRLLCLFGGLFMTVVILMVAASKPDRNAMADRPDGSEENQTHTTAIVPPTPAVELATTSSNRTQDGSSTDWTAIARTAKKTVFRLDVLNEHGQPYAHGTAFCLNQPGLIVTNAHVIKGSENFEAVTEQGASFKVTSVRYIDEAHDLAVLEIQAREWDGLALADAAPLETGDAVAVYGNPKGMQGSISVGVIAALRNGAELDAPKMGELIQLTAPISNGSSGSPVFNRKGEVIGIATMVLKESQNVNFAVPVSRLRELLATSPMEPGQYEMSIQAAPPASSEPKLPSPQTVAPSPVTTQEDLFWADPRTVSFKAAKDSLNWIEALRLSKALTESYPESPTAHFEMGYSAVKLQLFDLALQAYQKSIANDPADSGSWNNIGLIYGQMDRLADAEKAFERAVGIKTDNILAWSNLIQYRIINGKWSQATDALISLGKLDKATSEKILSRAQGAFIKSPPAGLKFMTRNFRAQFPLEVQNPEDLGKRLAARFLGFGAGKNVDAELRSYGDKVSPYFGESSKDAPAILRDLLDYREKWPARSYDLTGFESAKLNSAKTTLVARYSVRYQVAGGGKQRSGIVKHETTFSRVSEDMWIVTGIRTLSSKED